MNPVCTPVVSNISGNVITWVLPNPLHPNDEGSIYIVYEVPNDVNLLNTILISDATITSGQTDETPDDNTDDVGQLVVASCDPNDKSVEPAGDLSPQNVIDGDYLTYTIRFQNTGTYYAETVIITDEISDKLDLNFIETLSYSHHNTFSITGNKVIWTFNDILLPEAASNEAKSHGFVKFKIKLKNNLNIGDEITNSAKIYFDFNDPVITNTTTTIVAPPLKSVDLKYRLETAYPVLDTMRVYLANAIAPFEIIDSSIVFPEAINLKYNAFPSFEKAVSGVNYYIILKHRNSIETWSTPVTFTSDVISYDFTTSVSKAYGNNLKRISTAPVIYSIYGGDVNQDGTVDLNDMTRIDNDSYNFTTGYVDTDVNGDNFVDLHDMTIVDNNSYNFVSVIRP